MQFATAATLLGAAVIGMARAGLAQVSPTHSGARDKQLKFEVVSIRRNTAESGRAQTGPTAEGFRSIGLPLFAVIQLAFALPDQRGMLRGDQIEGGPSWLSDELYDVVARVEQADLADWQKPTMRQTMLRAMLQEMLGDRCKLVAHYGSKEAPVYELVTTKGGPKFKEAESVDTTDLRRKHPEGGIMRGSVTMVVEGSNRTQFYALSMSILTNTILSSIVDRPVIDKTALTGYYDVALPSPALRRPSQPPPNGAPPGLDAPASPPDDPSIFLALEGLGLRLQPAKGRVGTLVIERVERPSEN